MYIVLIQNFGDSGNHGFKSALIQINADSENSAKEKAKSAIEKTFAYKLSVCLSINLEISIMTQPENDAILLVEDADNQYLYTD